MTPEGRVKARIKAVLEGLNAYWHMPIQNGMGAPTLDFVQVQVPGCPAFAIEAKAPGEEPTARQWRTIKRIRDAGGTVFVIDGCTKEMEEWIAKQKILTAAHLGRLLAPAS